ncbi:hypothetical protein PRZ48_011283 [Zasmidium cellare]|uniref:O-methyltransferase C-terminal domain-containing protein n=1 Tax=Zasmidium cellare TaxID=395010 RepID=A0ABR0EAW5_ZASCE|nr:hypothetical protein PRZ48_011283 [Zasmidium cellare]
MSSRTSSLISNGTLLQSIESTDYGDFIDNASRRKALAAAQALVRRLQHPIDAVWDVALVYPALYSALKVGVDRNIFSRLDEDDGHPKSTTELACGGDVVVLRRMLRHLAAMNFIDELGPDIWGRTRLSSALTQREVFAHIDFVGDGSQLAFTGLPTFLKEVKYHDPSNATNGNWQRVIGSGKTYFEWLAERPREQQTFWDLMDGVASQPGSWTDVYPVETIFSGNNAHCALVVDVGGAEGRDMQTFVQRFPEASGRVVLQDQQAVIKTVLHLQNEGVIPMAHDFFTEQPIKEYCTIGKIGYPATTRPCLPDRLHGRPEDKAREILQNLKPAFVRGHSRLVVNEVVLPPRGATSDQTSLDLTMMALVSGGERSEEAWSNLIESCGFRVLGFYHSLASREEVIEAELA